MKSHHHRDTIAGVVSGPKYKTSIADLAAGVLHVGGAVLVFPSGGGWCSRMLLDWTQSGLQASMRAIRSHNVSLEMTFRLRTFPCLVLQHIEGLNRRWSQIDTTDKPKYTLEAVMSGMKDLCAETERIKNEAAKLAKVVHKTTRAEDWRTVLKRHLLWLTAVTMYSLLGVLCYSYLERDEETGKRWTAVEAFYFSVTTISTVGYGDYAPSTDGSRVFTAFYLTVGVSVVFYVMGDLYHYFIESSVYAVGRAIGRCWQVSAPPPPLSPSPFFFSMVIFLCCSDVVVSTRSAMVKLPYCKRSRYSTSFSTTFLSLALDE
jgi:hypothetical protein